MPPHRPGGALPGNATGDFLQLAPRNPEQIVSRAQACEAGFARKTTPVNASSSARQSQM